MLSLIWELRFNLSVVNMSMSGGGGLYVCVWGGGGVPAGDMCASLGTFSSTSMCLLQACAD